MRAALLVVVVRVLVKVEQVLVVLPEELVELGVLLSEAAEVLFVVRVVVGRTIIIIASFLGWQSSLIKVNSSPTQLLTEVAGIHEFGEFSIVVQLIFRPTTIQHHN